MNVDKDHDKRYVFSTGGDFDEEKGLLYPGMAIYHQGMDLIAVVATDNDVWQLNVRGQLVNETWSNIGNICHFVNYMSVSRLRDSIDF